MLLPLNQLSPSGRVAVYGLWLVASACLAVYVGAVITGLEIFSGTDGLQLLFGGLFLVPIWLCAMRAAVVRSRAASAQREADGAEREADGAQREEDGAQREADGAEREAHGAQREADGAQREEDLEESILRSAGEGIARLDNDGVVTFANPAASRMTGYAAGDLEGRFLHGRPSNQREDGSAYEEEIYPSLDSGHHAQDVDVYWREDGTSFPVEFTSTPILSGRGHVQGQVIVFKDITDRREADRVKNEFTSVVSHELRTPLTSIRGSLGLLESGVLGPLGEKGQRMIEIAVENTDRLIRLINDILDTERIKSGTIELERGECDSCRVAEQVVEEMLPMAKEAEVELTVACEQITLFADADRIHQVLTNLLSNAIKFSESGAAVRLSSELSQDMALFQVSDRGRGIPTEKLDAIFERFSQVDASDSREKGGTGLGLSICHTILEHLGGRIWVESELGKGSTFSFVLPLVPPAANGAGPVEHPAYDSVSAALRPDSGEDLVVGDSFHSPRPPGSAKVVLVVEDDTDLADVLVATLGRYGIKTFVAASGPEAISLSQRVHPDLLILDVGLPEVDGFEVVAWLRHHESSKSLRIVVYTAMDLDRPSRERLRLGGTTEFLTKGHVTPEDFETHVTRLLGLTAEDRAGVAADAA